MYVATRNGGTDNQISQYQSVKHKWRKKRLKRSKLQIKTMLQIVTGHSNLKRHRHLIKLECGEEEETAIHLLAECPPHANNRWQYLEKATLSLQKRQKDGHRTYE